MKRFVPIFLILLLLVGCGTGGEVSTSDPKPESSPSSVSEPAPETSSLEPPSTESKPEESPAPESPASSKEQEPEPEPDPEPESQPSASELKTIQPPPVAHGAELEDVDFSTMSKEKLVDLLQPVLERAKFFCRFGRNGELDVIGIEMDYSPEATIERPYRNSDKHPFYPCRNLSYQTVEELKQDMCTVFTPDILENEQYLAHIFNGLIDFDGRIYYPGDVSGYTKERRWELDKMEVVSATKNKLTISAPVSWGPSEETIVAPLNFEIKNGYIIMDDSYFATDIS